MFNILETAPIEIAEANTYDILRAGFQDRDDEVEWHLITDVQSFTPANCDPWSLVIICN